MNAVNWPSMNPKVNMIGCEEHGIELCKLLNFDHREQRNIHKPESDMENKTSKIRIQTHYSIPTKKLDIALGIKNIFKRMYMLRGAETKYGIIFKTFFF